MSLVKSGNSTLALTANNGYSGGTTILGGALLASNSSSNFSATGVGTVNVVSGTLGGIGAIGGSPGPGGAVTVQSGAPLLPGMPANVPGNQTASPIYGTLNVLGDLALQAGSSVNYGFGVSGQDLVAVAGALTLPTSGAININVTDTSGLAGQNTIFTYGSLTNFSTSDFTISGGTGFSIQLSALTDSIILVASGTNQNYVANVTWNTGSGTWDTTSPNWTGGSPNPALYKDSPVHDRAIFADIAGMPNITVTITPSGVFPSSTTFNNGATTYTIAAGTGIGGAGQLIESGSGTVILAGTNGYSGGTVLNGGTLETAAGDLSLVATGSPLTFNGGTLLTSTTALTTSRTITVNASGGTLETAGLGATLRGKVNVNGNFAKIGNDTVTMTDTLSVEAGQLTVQSGTVSLVGASYFDAPNSLTVASGAALVISRSNSTQAIYGATLDGSLVLPYVTRINVDALAISGSGAIYVQQGTMPDGSTSTFSNSTGSAGGIINVPIHLNSNNLPYTKTDVTAGALIVSPTTNGFMASVSGSPIDVYGVNTLTINGVIDGNSDVNFTVNSTGGGGGGNVLLNAQNTYAGATLINMSTATVTLGVNNALPVGTDLCFGTLYHVVQPTLDLNGHSQQVGSLSDGGQGTPARFTITNNGSSSGTLTISGSTTPYNSFGGSITDGMLTLALVKDGPNTLMLSGSNTYSGGTFVEGGTLIVETAASLGDGSNVTVGDPSAFATILPASAGELGAASSGVAPVPEPSSLALLTAIAVAGLAVGRRRRRV